MSGMGGHWLTFLMDLLPNYTFFHKSGNILNSVIAFTRSDKSDNVKFIKKLGKVCSIVWCRFNLLMNIILQHAHSATLFWRINKFFIASRVLWVTPEIVLTYSCPSNPEFPALNFLILPYNSPFSDNYTSTLTVMKTNAKVIFLYLYRIRDAELPVTLFSINSLVSNLRCWFLILFHVELFRNNCLTSRFQWKNAFSNHVDPSGVIACIYMYKGLILCHHPTCRCHSTYRDRNKVATLLAEDIFNCISFIETT